MTHGGLQMARHQPVPWHELWVTSMFRLPLTVALLAIVPTPAMGDDAKLAEELVRQKQRAQEIVTEADQRARQAFTEATCNRVRDAELARIDADMAACHETADEMEKGLERCGEDVQCRREVELTYHDQRFFGREICLASTRKQQGFARLDARLCAKKVQGNNLSSSDRGIIRELRQRFIQEAMDRERERLVEESMELLEDLLKESIAKRDLSV